MMRNRFDNRRPTALEDQAHAEAVRHFAEHLKQFPVNRQAVERLERDVAKIALAANMAAAKPTSQPNIIQADDGAQWHKSVELMENIHFCHRPMTGGAEYAVVEYSPTCGTNEIWHQGRNAGEVLQLFTHEQRQALQMWTEDMTTQVKEFLAEKFPGQNLSRVTDSFMHRFTKSVSQQQSQSQEQNHRQGVRI